MTPSALNRFTADLIKTYSAATRLYGSTSAALSAAVAAKMTLADLVALPTLMPVPATAARPAFRKSYSAVAS